MAGKDRCGWRSKVEIRSLLVETSFPLPSFSSFNPRGFKSSEFVPLDLNTRCGSNHFVFSLPPPFPSLTLHYSLTQAPSQMGGFAPFTASKHFGDLLLARGGIAGQDGRSFDWGPDRVERRGNDFQSSLATSFPGHWAPGCLHPSLLPAQLP